jgi:S-DNA-T family DNA segregation ATPase FtsK/SpoIIIE
MVNSRNRAADVAGLCLVVVTLFLTFSLSSYHATDPISEPFFPLNRFYRLDPVAYPLAESVQNSCGPMGALAADMLLQTFGRGAYYVVLSLGALALMLFRQKPFMAPIVRWVGWSLSLTGLTTLVALVGTSDWVGPAIGPGGYLGALGRGLLGQYFGLIGSLLLAGAACLLGVLLCTDYVLLHLAALTAKSAATNTLRRRARRTTPTDLGADGADDEMQIRFGSKRRTTSARQPAELDQDDEEEDEEAYEADEEDDEEDIEEEEDDELEEDDEEQEEAADDAAAATARSGLRGLLHRATPGLRIRKSTADIEQAERREVIEQLEEASRKEDARQYDLPSIDLLEESEEFSFEQQEKEVRRKAKILEKTFQDFGFNVRVVEIETGPVIAQYEIELEAGLRLSKITGLADDLAIALRVPSVRIVAPIPGKNTVGIEVPNEQRQTVRLREVMEESNGRAKKMRIPLFLGKDVSGNPLVVDLSTLPHLLIAGRTGTGKSVCLNAIISSMLMTRRPDEVRMLMIDPKMVELSGYKTLPHLMHPVVTDMRKAEAILAWAVDKMEERYALLARAGVRHISGYNQLGEEELIDRLQPEDDAERSGIPIHLPYIVIVADEMADLMMTSGKEVEQHIIRLAQKSRAVGIHLILATQKPTVDVITGLIKSNLPARIAFQVASRTDSRVVLDEMGADKLLGNGDMLFLWPGTSTLLRGQGTYLSDDEINAIVEFVSTGEQDFVRELVQLKVETPGDGSLGDLKQRDELYESAVEIVIREGRGSVSLLQRCLGIGYGRAARLIDFMAEDGIVGPYNGSQAREVVISLADWQAMQAGASAEAEPEPIAPPPRRAHRVVNVTPSRTTNTRQEKEWEEDEPLEDNIEQPDEDEEPEDELDEGDADEDAENEAEEDEEDEYDEDEDEYEDEDEEEEELEVDDEDVDEYEGEEYEGDEYEYDEEDEESDDDDTELVGDEDEPEEYEDEDEDYDAEEFRRATKRRS